jgi:hypothetical protein
MEALRLIRELPYMMANWKPEVQEFRITVKDLSVEDTEARAYYTNDAHDALLTARYLSAETVELRKLGRC